MTHPPIPPNCHALFESGGRGWFRMSFDGIQEQMEIETWLFADHTMRPIIAAVARCAWLDAVCYDHPDWDNCQLNAERWRTWGASVDSSMKEPQ